VKNEIFIHIAIHISYMLDWIRNKLKQRKSTHNLELIPWTDAHSGNFGEEQNAYTLVVDGDITNISFAIDVSDPKAPNWKHVDMTIPAFVAQYGVEIEDGVLNNLEEEE